MTSRTYATEARRVLPHYQKKLAEHTEGAHQGSHPALVDPAIKDPDNPHPLPGSQVVLAENLVKTNLTKHSRKEENTLQ